MDERGISGSEFLCPSAGGSGPCLFGLSSSGPYKSTFYHIVILDIYTINNTFDRRLCIVSVSDCKRTF